MLFSKKLLFCALLCSSLILQSQVFGFSMGYHCDIINEVLRHEGYSERTIQLAMASNEFTDLYGTEETFMLIDDDIMDEIYAVADFFHSTRQLNYSQIVKNTEMIIQNTAGLVQENVQMADNNSYWAYTKILVAMGISIHRIQDFYAHSNWAELDMPFFTKIKDATLFDVMYSHEAQLTQAINEYLKRGTPKSQNGVYTNYTDQEAPVPQHNDIYKDFAARAEFDNAYRAAYKATLQWVRWIESMIDQSKLSHLKNFQWKPEDHDLDDFTSYDNESGTARYMCLYGGAWKYWKRWSWEEVLMHDLENIPGIDLSNSTFFGKPVLYELWKPVCLTLGHGVFKINKDCDPNNPTCEVIDNTNVIIKDFPYSDLPLTNEYITHLAISTMSNATFLSEYNTIKWINLNIPFMRDNDNGDGIINVNDEDFGSSSDYYVEWYVGTQSTPVRYVESIYIEKDKPYTNCQVLKPCWPNEGPVNVKLIVRDSDKVDWFKALVHLGISGVGYIASTAVSFIQTFTGIPIGIFAIDDILNGFLRLFDGTSDDGMDISPDNNANDLTFSIDPDNFTLFNYPTKCIIDQTPYGYYLKSAGNDDENSVWINLQIGQGAPKTKVRISVLDMCANFKHSNQKPRVDWESSGSINNYEIPGRSFATSRSSPSIINVNDNAWKASESPNWEMTYESYIDEASFPIQLKFKEVSWVLPPGQAIESKREYSMGTYNLIYSFSDHSITDANTKQIIGVSGDTIVFRNIVNNKVDDSILCRIEIDEGIFNVQQPSQMFVKYSCIDPNSPDDEHIKPAIQIVNKGNTDVPLSELKVRYWYTAEGYQTPSFWVDETSLPDGSIKNKFVATTYMTGSDGYCEIGFSSDAGMLSANDSTNIFKFRFNKYDWKPYNETDDYSYDGSIIELTPHPQITLYRNSILIYGNEPDFIPVDEQPKPAVQVFIRDEGFSEGNIVKPRIYVKNTGLITIPRFEMRYHFTVENNKTPVLQTYYAPQSIVSLCKEGDGEYYISYIVECPGFGAGAVYPDLNGNVVGIHYDDWSYFNKNNDFSNPGSATFIETDKIEIIFLQQPFQPPSSTVPQNPISGVQKFIKDEGISESNIVKPRLYIKNIGHETISGDIDIKYYFTVENNKTPVVEGWYLPQTIVSLKNMGQNNYCAILHIGNVNLAPGAALPGNDGYTFGIHYSDWSYFNKSNDPSNPGSGVWVETENIDVVQ